MHFTKSLLIATLFCLLLHHHSHSQACFNATGSNGLRRGCAPFTITVTDCSGSATTILYKYSEKEGLVSRTTNTYTSPGIYDITQFLNSGGAGDSVRKYNYIEVLDSPKPVFSVKYCKNKEVSLSITDVVYEEYIVNWGDGTTQTFARGSTSDIRHTYASSTSFALTVTGNYVPGGCGGSDALIINPLSNIIKADITELNTIVNRATTGTISISFLTDPNFNYTVQQKSTSSPLYQNLTTIAGDGKLYTYTQNNLNTITDSFTYKVTASDRCGNTLDSDEITNITLNVTAQDSKNQISWTAYPGINFKKYTVYKNNVLWQTITNQNTTSLTDTDVYCNTDYCYIVYAEIGTSISTLSVSNQVCVTAFSTVSPPKATAFNSSISNNNQINLKWSAPRKPLINSYIITRYTYNLNASLPSSQDDIVINDSVQSAIDDNLAFDNPVSRYCYEVKYVNECGLISTKSAMTCPVILQLFSNKGDKILLNWSAYKNSESDFLGYTLEKLDEMGNVYSSVPLAFASQYTDNTNLTDRQILRYRIKVTLKGGTTYSYSNILVVKQNFKIFLPNVFTPNNDGVNDLFEAKGLFINKFKMVIYNRAGQLLFTSNSITEGWDGTLNGTPQNADAYIYIIDLEDEKGEKFSTKGTFSLLR